MNLPASISEVKESLIHHWELKHSEEDMELQWLDYQDMEPQYLALPQAQPMSAALQLLRMSAVLHNHPIVLIMLILHIMEKTNQGIVILFLHILWPCPPEFPLYQASHPLPMLIQDISLMLPMVPTMLSLAALALLTDQT